MNTIIEIQGINLQGQVVRDRFRSDSYETTKSIMRAFKRMYNLSNVIIL